MTKKLTRETIEGSESLESSYNEESEISKKSKKTNYSREQKFKYVKFKRDRAYKMILRSARKILKKKFYRYVEGRKVYRMSDEILL